MDCIIQVNIVNTFIICINTLNDSVSMHANYCMMYAANLVQLVVVHIYL